MREAFELGTFRKEQGGVTAQRSEAPSIHPKRRAMNDFRTTKNGLDLGQSEQLAEAVAAEQGPALLSLRTRHRWAGGLAVDSRGEYIELLGQSSPRAHHASRHDLPPPLGGKDTGPAPTEALLSAVAACVCGIFVEGATQHGIDIEELEVSMQGAIDLRGLFQTAEVRSGLSEVTLTLGVRADADDEVLAELARVSVGLSPSAESLANPVPIRLELRRLPKAESPL